MTFDRFKSYLPGHRVLVKILLGYCLLQFGCTQIAENERRTAVYHWRTVLNFSPEEQRFLVKISAERVYTKFFDLDWSNGEAAPAAIIRAGEEFRLPDSLELVPVVFITNRTFKNLDPATIPNLAKRTAELIQNRLAHLGTTAPEWQFDCDWTPSTRDLFFEFLKAIRTHQPPGTALSSTVRLHQFRYPERTGVPPVDRGVLMVYNVGRVDDPNETNSILTYEAAAAYLEPAGGYPLPLDVALPIYRWGVVYRHGELVRLIDGLAAEELRDTSSFESLGETRFRLKKSQYLRGNYFYHDDVIRTEAIDSATFHRTRELALAAVGVGCERVILYKLEDAPQLSFDLAGGE